MDKERREKRGERERIAYGGESGGEGWKVKSGSVVILQPGVGASWRVEIGVNEVSVGWRR